MTRIIAGSHRGHRLRVPTEHVRPTTDRTREALFSTLDAMLDHDWSNVDFLDVCAGSGAVGLEAVSRGAASVTVIESSRHVLTVLRHNVAAIGGDVTVIAHDAERVATAPGNPATIAYVDPPYDWTTERVDALLAHMASHGWIDDETVIVLERSVRSEPPTMLRQPRDRRYGETVLWYGHIISEE